MFASTNRQSLYYSKETVWGETPATPAMSEVKFTSESLNHAPTLADSNTIRADRMRDDLLRVSEQAEGDINAEFAYGVYDDFLEAALMGTWTANVLKNGSTERSFLVEREFTDITAVGARKFIYYNGLEVNQLQLNITAKEIVTATFGFLGKHGVSGTATVSASKTPAALAVPLTASANIGNLQKDGVALAAAIRSIQLTVANNLRTIDAIGSVSAQGLASGFIDVSGQIDFFVQDLSIYNLIETDTAFALSFDLTDAAGNKYSIVLPKIRLSRAQTNATGGNAEMMLNCDIKGLRDSVSGAEIQITRVPFV